MIDACESNFSNGGGEKREKKKGNALPPGRVDQKKWKMKCKINNKKWQKNRAIHSREKKNILKWRVEGTYRTTT